MRVSAAENETAEGVVELLEKHDFSGAYFLWPHSLLSRPLLSDYLASRKIPCDACVFYETHTRRPASLPDLSLYDEIVFTSPSTVDAFVALYGALPTDKLLTPIGPVTAKRLF
jgi:uroporphyrinogen-III synthase